MRSEWEQNELELYESRILGAEQADYEIRIKRAESKCAVPLHSSHSSHTEAVKRNPENHFYYSNRAVAYLKVREWQLSLNDASKCVELDAGFIKGFVLFLVSSVSVCLSVSSVPFSLLSSSSSTSFHLKTVLFFTHLIANESHSSISDQTNRIYWPTNRTHLIA